LNPESKLDERNQVGQAVSPANTVNLYEYRRRLPHFQPHAAYVFLTWRLWGSLPIRFEPSPQYPSPGHAFVVADRALERQSFGPRWLIHPQIANLVAERASAGNLSSCSMEDLIPAIQLRREALQHGTNAMSTI
jgi:hypothetical protein